MGKNVPDLASLGEACCGCGACAARCPKGCITMDADACGFLQPRIDVATCIGCGACDATCPVLNVPENDGCVKAVWAKAKNDCLRERSSSGGVFGVLAQEVLARGGVVIGAAWGIGCRELRHVLVEDVDKLDTIMRSKYVQSAVGRKVFEDARDVIRGGSPVIFCGTACQVAGMRSYLGKLADTNLFLGVDVICHGVPSPELWRRWLAYVEKCENGLIRDVNFRSKATGWSSYSVMYEYKTENEGTLRSSSKEFTEDWYMRSFLKNASLRSSCLSCPFKRRCGSDLTIGDFWGVKDSHPEAFDDMGTSAVLVCTGKGAAAIEAVSQSFVWGESSFAVIAAGNSSLVLPAKPCVNRYDFMHDLAERTPIPKMIERWSFKPALWSRILSCVKCCIKYVFGL